MSITPAAAPSVSAVVPVRNDDWGTRLRERARLTLRLQAAVFDEVVVVDFNSAVGVLPLVETLRLPASARRRLR